MKDSSLTLPRFVAPTLVEAVRRLSGDTARGFTFVRADGSERFCSFQDIHAEAEKRAGALQACGIAKGDRVALVIPEGDEFVLTFLGAIFAGAVPVPVYPQLSFKNVDAYHDTVAHIANASGATLLVTTAGTRPYVEPIAARAPALRSLVTVDDLALAGGAFTAVDVAPGDLCFLQFTSGSTSRPKGVVVTHANLAWNSESFMIHGLAKDSAVDKGVSWLPLFHDMGLIGFVIGPLFTDIPVVFLPTASFVRSPRLWLETIHKHRGTITYAPNFAYALVAKRLKARDLEGFDLSCIKIAGCGAEPIQARTLRDFAEKTGPAGFDPRAFVPSYGMAEATLAITFTPQGKGLNVDTVDPKALQRGAASAPAAGAAGDDQVMELVDCGVPFPEHEVAIRDEAGNPLGDRKVGQIFTRGPSVCAGYYQEAELTAASFEGGWLATGDLGYLASGRLFICGRLKDIIIIRGRNFYPNDIEWAVSEIPDIKRGSVVAFGADVAGEEQLVLCAEAFQRDAAAVTEAVSQRVAAQFGLSVHKVEIVPPGSLPRTSSGKPQRRKTKQLFLDGTLPRARLLQEAGTEETPAATET